jgi:hypothetical protein
MALVGNRELILINSSVPGLREFCVLRHARFLEKTSVKCLFSRENGHSVLDMRLVSRENIRAVPVFSRKHAPGILCS